MQISIITEARYRPSQISETNASITSQPKWRDDNQGIRYLPQERSENPIPSWPVLREVPRGQDGSMLFRLIGCDQRSQVAEETCRDGSTLCWR